MFILEKKPGQINDLGSYLKELEKEQMKHKVRGKEIIKIYTNPQYKKDFNKEYQQS